MATKALLDVLEQTIGKYVRNLDAESLNVAVWSGKIELQNLELDCDAVNAALDRQAAEAPNLAIPLRVTDGRFKQLSVNVPWRRITSDSVVLRASGLTVTVEPHDRTAGADFMQAVHENEEKRALRIQEARNKKIRDEDGYRQRANALKNLAAADLEGGDQSGFGARLVRRIIENLHVEITDVHVELKGGGCETGVVLQSLELRTTDQSGKPTFVDRATSKSSFLFKSLQIHGFGIYMDEKEVAHLSSISEMEETDSPDHTYILAPLSLQAKLRQADSDICVEFPRYHLSSELEFLSVILSHSQLQLARSVMAQMTPAQQITAPLFPEYRPIRRISPQTRKLWWKYAVRCVGRLNGRRSWTEFALAFQTRQRYIPLYKRQAHHITCPWMKRLSESEVVELTAIEEDRTISVEGIMHWRTLADAQVRREKEKHAVISAAKKPSIMSSIFGVGATTEEEEDEDTPIQLTPSELRELEEVNGMDENDELSDDSKLCDVSFTLGAFKVILTRDFRPLVALQMGTVGTQLKAMSNGAFDYNFSLSSLEVTDKSTLDTLFPAILRNQEGQIARDAFRFELGKAENGDQQLKAKLSTFEFVASPELLKEMQRFFSTETSIPAHKVGPNAILQQSVSGSVDLFYDAVDTGAYGPSISSIATDVDGEQGPSVVAEKLIDAWKLKTSTKTKWSVDMDLSAPIGILPESSTNPYGKVLVFDLGHFRLQYSTTCSHNAVSDWFRDNPQVLDSPPTREYGSFKAENLTFIIAEAKHWRGLLKKQQDSNSDEPDGIAVIRPMSLDVFFGVESSPEKPSRVPLFGEMPSIDLCISVSQISGTKAVFDRWTRILDELKDSTEDADDSASVVGSKTSSALIEQAEDPESFSTKLSIDSLESKNIPLLFAHFNLKRCSLQCLTTGGNDVEGNLVSVVASYTQMSHGDSASTLTMGCFWIRDNIEGNFSRRERLLAHSALPENVLSILQRTRRNAYQEVERLGLIQDSQLDDHGLARISIQSSPLPFGETDAWECLAQTGTNFAVTTLINANFQSLHVNWNPRAIKLLVATADTFTSAWAADTSAVIVEKMKRDRAMSTASRESSRIAKGANKQTGSMLLRVQFDGFVLSLLSAQDDSPLFLFRMCQASVSGVFEGDRKRLMIGVSDLRVETSGSGKTDPSFACILGLAPGSSSKRLLFVDFCEEAASRQPVHGTKIDIVLSPVRLVHIHAQIMALVEYTTEGILGALAAQVAATTTAAAVEYASNTAGNKLINVQATGAEVVLPKAAYEYEWLSVNADGLALDYESIENTGISTVKAKVSSVRIRDSKGVGLQKRPVELTVGVVLPPEGVGSMDDQAMKVDLDFPSAEFVISKLHYNMFMAILSMNVGDADLYLRDDSDKLSLKPSSGNSTDREEPIITHAGNMFVEKVGRTFLNVTIGSFSLDLNLNDDEPLLSLTSRKAHLSLQLLSDQGRLVSNVSLDSLECLDRRVESFSRQYRTLLFQPEYDDNDQGDSSLFRISYESNPDGSSSTKLNVGSPCFVFIPDAVAALLGFVSGEAISTDSPSAQATITSAPTHQKVGATISGSNVDEVEAIYSEESLPKVAATNFEISTERCSVIFVDLGSDATVSGTMTMSSSAAEIVAIDGCFSGRVRLDKDIATGERAGMDSQLDVDSLEVYTAFGSTRESPLQILEPTRMSVYCSMKSSNENSEFDVRAAAVEPVDLVLSMRNVALANAIASTLAESFESDVAPNASESATEKPKNGMSSTNSIKITLPEAKVTLVNDLQGLDEALVRIVTKNLVVSGQVRTEDVPKSSPFTAFDLNIHTSILSDFFDSSSVEWRAFLQKPWELSLKSKRSRGERFGPPRPSTTLDVESFPCFLSFSELFLMNVASAYRMWSVYSTATQHDPTLNSNRKDVSLRERRSIAVSAARTFVSSLPYACENHCGADLQFRVSDKETKPCPNLSMEFFRFDPPPGKGRGGKRLYGQDVSYSKELSVFERDTKLVSWSNIDDAVGSIPRLIESKDGLVALASISRDSKTTVCHISSGFDIENRGSVSFDISVDEGSGIIDVGNCGPAANRASSQRSSANLVTSRKGRISKPTKRFAIPAGLLRSFYSSWKRKKECSFSFRIRPRIENEACSSVHLLGVVQVRLNNASFRGQQVLEWVETITCDSIQQASQGHTAHPFAVQARFAASLCNGYPVVGVVLEPRAILENGLPIGISVKTPMPHTYSAGASIAEETLHSLEPESKIEVYTPGPSVAVSVSCRDLPVGGTPTGWMDVGWVDLPLVAEFRIPEPVRCRFPFSRKSINGPLLLGGSNFLISEGKEHLVGIQSFEGAPPPIQSGTAAETDIELSVEEQNTPRTFFVSTPTYAVDHTGEVLFESMESELRVGATVSGSQDAVPLGAYRSHRHHGRVSLLPGSSAMVRLLHLTMKGDEGVRKTVPFSVEDISICEGGLNATPLMWGDGQQSGFFAYRRLLNSFQSELHIIPEYVVYNGSKTHCVLIRETQGTEVSIPPGEIGALHTNEQEAAVIAIGYPNHAARTALVKVDSLGLRVAAVKNRDGTPIGRVAIQTVVGAQDSKIVVKLGDLHSDQRITESRNEEGTGFFSKDHFRCRVQWTELQVSLYEARAITDKRQAVFESALDHFSRAVSSSNENPRPGLDTKKKETWVSGRSNNADPAILGSPKPVCTLLFHRFTIDWQRVFKEESRAPGDAFSSPERSQLAVIVHNIQVRDETPGSPYPVVLDSTTGTSFFDLCIRSRGSIDKQLLKIDLFDLNLAHSKGVSQKITINTDETFVWKLLDLADRILAAASEFAGYEIKLTWDEQNSCYAVSFEEPMASFIDAEAHYEPPKSDTILAMKKIRVSPFSVVVSFKRKPDASRYKIRRGVRGANAMNYFSRKLKFKIEKAELKFARYEAANIEGPPDRLLEILSTVYLSRVKMKLLTILSAATFQDWKTLASRDDGNDDFVDGDILRATGSIAGRTANMVFRKAGKGLGSGVSNITHKIGDGFENATSAIGVRGVGAGVNSIVSGVGDGVGDTISGVGSGAGKILRGAGQGVGQVFGGVSGGALMIGKGIGKGITDADGQAVTSGFIDGAKSIGVGVGQGVGSVVNGAVGGVGSVGHGLFSGVKNVGLGIGGALTGKKTPRKKRSPKDES